MENLVQICIYHFQEQVIVLIKPVIFISAHFERHIAFSLFFFFGIDKDVENVLLLEVA